MAEEDHSRLGEKSWMAEFEESCHSVQETECQEKIEGIAGQSRAEDAEEKCRCVANIPFRTADDVEQEWVAVREETSTLAGEAARGKIVGKWRQRSRQVSFEPWTLLSTALHSSRPRLLRLCRCDDSDVGSRLCGE